MVASNFLYHFIVRVDDEVATTMVFGAAYGTDLGWFPFIGMIFWVIEWWGFLDDLHLRYVELRAEIFFQES